jgi:hypothetical protein
MKYTAIGKKKKRNEREREITSSWKEEWKTKERGGRASASYGVLEQVRGIYRQLSLSGLNSQASLHLPVFTLRFGDGIWKGLGWWNGAWERGVGSVHGLTPHVSRALTLLSDPDEISRSHFLCYG